MAESMSAESMAEFYDAAEQFESSTDESEVSMSCVSVCVCVCVALCSVCGIVL